MLEPREADLPVLFMVLVVLPVVAYILLGKWSDVSKKRERITLLAELAADEAFKAQSIKPIPVSVPFVPTSNYGIHVCARCLSPATTRCSRCKSVRYCSGKCQIIHWRQVHKLECQQIETAKSCSSSKATSIQDSFPERALVNDGLDASYYASKIKQAFMDYTSSDKTMHPSISNVASTGAGSMVETSQEGMLPKRCTSKRLYHKFSGEIFRQEPIVLDSLEETSETMCGNLIPLNGASNVLINGNRSMSLAGKMFESRNKYQPLNANAGNRERKVHETEIDCILNGGNMSNVENNLNDGKIKLNCSFETPVMKDSENVTCASQPSETKTCKSLKSMIKSFGEQSYSGTDGSVDDSKVFRLRNAIPAPGNNEVASAGIMKMDLRKSKKLTRQNAADLNGIRRKMLFPYDEFVKIFNCEVVNLSPRGLLNCGNSCYANAVLQCLTCTKPLTIFLLCRSHSRGCKRDRCLMCELEKHVLMLREFGGPLSPSRILMHIQNINCQIGDGSQEDAHEFLRLLVACMQSTCLEGLGGEDKVNPVLQETTFIQHTFSGRLRSKVKCLRCHHESERYESIMDLTLEIFGWVESLEDALTQFTTPEELDGENMYKCGRCATYVRARKQLSIHEAPNILTVVLKRFQEGKYGKLSKYITFPDMLDMIPFMTGTCDIPPLYMLYAVVVHLDTLNASFSGHYVAYVKDLQGNWFRVDDTQVTPVPMTQVMSEGAYILFYTRSCPRPQRESDEKAVQQQVPTSARHRMLPRTCEPSRRGHSKSSSNWLGLEPQNGTSNINRSVAQAMEFSDATSSDWSLFTSSDEASFTTESTRDSFSTVDYADTCNVDTFSSIFDNLYTPQSSRNTLCRRAFSNSRSQTMFISEERGYVLDSYLSMQRKR